jgi:hypothetical protein
MVSTISAVPRGTFNTAGNSSSTLLEQVTAVPLLFSPLFCLQVFTCFCSHFHMQNCAFYPIPCLPVFVPKGSLLLQCPCFLISSLPACASVPFLLRTFTELSKFVHLYLLVGGNVFLRCPVLLYVQLYSRFRVFSAVPAATLSSIWPSFLLRTNCHELRYTTPKNNNSHFSLRCYCTPYHCSLCLKWFFVPLLPESSLVTVPVPLDLNTSLCYCSLSYRSWSVPWFPEL